MLFQSRKGCLKKHHKHIPLPNAVFAKCNIQRREYFHSDIPTSCGIKKNCSPNKTMWLIAFAGELGDGVSRPLPHGIWGASEDTQVGGFPQKSGLVCAWTFLYLSRSVAGARGVRFRREPTSLTFLRGKHGRKLFLKSWKLFLKSWTVLLKSQKLFLKSQKLFLNLGPNPETIYKTRIAFTNPSHWTRIAVNHWKCRDCPRQVSHVLTERERLPGCWRRHPSFCFVVCSFCFVLCSLTPHLRISHCFFLTFQTVRSFNMSSICVYICQLRLYLSLLLCCFVWWFKAE